MATQYEKLNSELRAIEKKLENSKQLSADTELRENLIRVFGAEKVVKMDADVIVHEAQLREELVRLRILVDAEWEISCNRCLGSGQYKAPTSHTRNGIPVCFTCKGSGLSAKGKALAHKH